MNLKNISSILLIFLISCSYKKTISEDLVLKQKLEQTVLSLEKTPTNDSLVFAMKDLTPFEWNHFWIFLGSSTPKEAIEERLNYHWNWEHADRFDGELWIFTKEDSTDFRINEVVSYMYFPNPVSFSTNAEYSPYAPDRANFIAKKIDGNFYLRLR